MDKSWDIVGTTHNGGTDDKGVVFGISAKGEETTLHNFQSGNDGYAPDRGPVADAGNPYGMTLFGPGTGCNGDGCGVVYKIAQDGTETILHAVTGENGYWPNASVVGDNKGLLYGATWTGGVNGVLFKPKE